MAQGGAQISSLHLAIAAGGGVLLYAALRGVSPAAALKDITSGAPPAVSTEGKRITASGGELNPDFVPGGNGTIPWKGGPYKRAKVPKAFQTRLTFVAAAQTHAGEKYSQEQRWSKGYSDCSSFVGKALLDIGVEPPGGSTTSAFLGSGQWVKVTTPQVGDVAVNARHMAIFTSGSAGIGMQNKRRNVQRDVMDNLMANTGAWEIRRYRGWA
jgi:hypothetical protein